MGMPIGGEWANEPNVAQLEVRQCDKISNGENPCSGSRDKSFSPMGTPIGANGQMSLMLHNYRSRQSNRISNGENPCSGSRDSFLPMGTPIGGEWANDHVVAQLQVKTILWNFEWRKSVKQF